MADLNVDSIMAELYRSYLLLGDRERHIKAQKLSQRYKAIKLSRVTARKESIKSQMEMLKGKEQTDYLF